MESVTEARIIPVLQILKDEAVKTVQFGKPHYIGDPINSVKLFSDYCADELVVMDIGAARGNYPIQLDLLSRMTSEAFMPFGYGGGVRDINHADKLFALGIEKVLIRWRGPESEPLIQDVSRTWGCQAVSVVIDYVNHKRLKFRNIPCIKREDVVGQIQKIQDAGAGELVVQSVDRDGTMSGFDLDLIGEVIENLSIQLVALGGAGSSQDISRALHAGASAVAAGSFFVFRDQEKAVLINYPSESQLKSLTDLSRIKR